MPNLGKTIRNYCKCCLQMLSANAPDIIVITGDLVDAGHTDIDVTLNFVNEAVQIAPVYYVTGNHEASLPQYDEFKVALERIGTTVLEDRAIQLQRGSEEIMLIRFNNRPEIVFVGASTG